MIAGFHHSLARLARERQQPHRLDLADLAELVAQHPDYGVTWRPG